jgi:hypothetical protein
MQEAMGWMTRIQFQPGTPHPDQLWDSSNPYKMGTWIPFPINKPDEM